MNDSAAKGYVARFKRLWNAMRQVLAVRGLLQWLGLWKHIPVLLTALISGALAQWAHIRGLSGPNIALIGIASFVLLTLVGAIVMNYLALGKQPLADIPRQDVGSVFKHRSQYSLSIHVKLRELHRKEIDFQGTYPGGEWEFNIFLRARIELTEPQQVVVDNYKLELSMSGLPEVPQLQADLNDWQLLLFEPIQQGVGWTEHGLYSLPHYLKRGEPAEGWLHFVTRKTHPQLLDQCVVRLIVQTRQGSQSGEQGPDPNMWNPDRRTISRKS